MQTFYSDVSKNLPVFLSGDNNNSIGETVYNLAEGLFTEIFNGYSEGQSTVPMVEVYHNSMRLGLTLVRCQKESTFDNEKITDMINLFTNGMNPETSNSLPAMGIKSNSDENITFLNNVLALRQPGATSWINVNNLLAVVSWKG